MPEAIIHLFDQPEEDIRCKCPLVSLIKDDHAVPFQERIAHGFPQKHSIGQEPTWRSEHAMEPRLHSIDTHLVPLMSSYYSSTSSFHAQGELPMLENYAAAMHGTRQLHAENV